jgi:translocation and assembly module TamA
MLLAIMAALGAVLLFRTSAGFAQSEIRYDTFIDVTGLDDKKLIELLRNGSQLVALEDRRPASLAALRRRAENDLPRLSDIMQAQGYWQAQLSYAIAPKDDEHRVTVTIDPGALFHIATVAFQNTEGGPLALAEKLGPAAFGLAIGDPARSAPVANAERQITEEYARNAHPFAKVTDRKAVIDIATHTMAISYTVDPGAEARFGALTVDGLKRVDRDYVDRRIAWREGDPYDSRKVETTRQDLVKTNLFSSVRISHADALDDHGEVPMTIELAEGAPRSIGAGVAYNTNLGFGGSTFWEHRNLFGGGEDLRLSAGAAQRQLGVALAFRKPDFIDRNQSLLANAELLRVETDAFRSRRAVVFTGIERPLLPSITLDTGVSVEHANVTETTRSENYSLIGLPVVLRRDTTDDLLDPTIGSRQTLTMTPYHSIAGATLNFITSRIEERHYQRLDSTGRLLLAGYAALGSTVGVSRDTLPADKRFYAGGAGSVRGYGFQRAGPLGPDNEPLGGISSLELGLEFRYRITDTIGLAPFIEGGNVYPTSLPNSLKLFYGAGIGFRYYTVVGPIRLDIATPFERRPGDDAVQFYISIGQAF